MNYICIARKTNATLGYTKNKEYECDFVSRDLSHILTHLINDNGDNVIAYAGDFDFKSKKKVQNMQEIRTVRLEKYMEIIIDSTLIKNKINFSNSPEVRIDLNMDANIFYGITMDEQLYQLVCINDFDKYDCIFRLLNWKRNKNKEQYTFRVLKTNKNDKLDFEEEKEYLKSFIEIKI